MIACGQACRVLPVLLFFAHAGCKGGGAASCHAAVDGGALQPPRYLVAQPALVETRVIDLAGETRARELVARSLQGVVNRGGVRLYLLDDLDSTNVMSPYAREAHQHWLSEYQARGLIPAPTASTLDDALAAFAPGLEGYVLASESEPWSINAAATATATRAVLIATDETAPALASLGLHQLDSFVGRWPDGASAYAELADKVGTMPHPGFAIMATDLGRLYDFVAQQGVLTLGGYQSMPDWAGVEKALGLVPREVPLYGYPARNGAEELHSVTEISQAGAVLVASDSTPNLSFHVAVRPPTLTRAPAASTAVDCNQAELNVVIGLSDGDNLIVPLMHYPTSRYWLAPERGRIPISWSISGALATVAPAAFDYYARTLAPGDELVLMIGPGYAYGGDMPNADWFYGVAFAQMQSLGLRVLWLFDPIESGSGKYSWQAAATQAVSCGRSTGLLDGYYPSFFGAAPSDETVQGVPILRASGEYGDGPQQIADRIREQLAQPRSQRPRVAFYSAAVWNNDVPGLVQALAPLEEEGVRFLGASAGMMCAQR